MTLFETLQEQSRVFAEWQKLEKGLDEAVREIRNAASEAYLSRNFTPVIAMENLTANNVVKDYPFKAREILRTLIAAVQNVEEFK